jgi:hypothetical protein
MELNQFDAIILVKDLEQKQIKLLEILRSTSVGLIRLAATDEGKKQAIISLPHFEVLWLEAHNFCTKWRSKLMDMSDKFKNDLERLKSELDLICNDFTFDYQNLLANIINLKKKK